MIVANRATKHSRRLAMKNTIKYILLGTLIAVGSQEVMAQQNTSTAVMEVRATVVSGSTIAMVGGSEIQNREFQNENGENREFTVGGFSITLPEGVEILSEIENEIELENGSYRMNVDTELHQTDSREGAATFQVTGFNRSNIISNTGIYSGKQVATIQYL